MDGHHNLQMAKSSYHNPKLIPKFYGYGVLP